jgi:hypothetical protein
MTECGRTVDRHEHGGSGGAPGPPVRAAAPTPGQDEDVAGAEDPGAGIAPGKLHLEPAPNYDEEIDARVPKPARVDPFRILGDPDCLDPLARIEAAHVAGRSLPNLQGLAGECPKDSRTSSRGLAHGFARAATVLRSHGPGRNTHDPPYRFGGGGSRRSGPIAGYLRGKGLAPLCSDDGIVRSHGRSHGKRVTSDVGSLTPPATGRHE